MAAATQSVTKEIFLASFTCRTQGWFLRNQAMKPTPSPGDLLRMEEGIEIGRRARELFPRGILVAGGNIASASARTKELLLDRRVETIFEATFHIDGFTARADILRRVDGGWHLIEVKSNVGDKAELIDDLAYTAMVLERSGVAIIKASLLLLSKDYRLGMDNSKLFVEVDHTVEVQAKVREFLSVCGDVETKTRQADRPKPTLLLACRDCRFFEAECLGRGVKNSILELPRLHPSKFQKLLDQGITLIPEIPVGFALTDNQARVRQCVISGEQVVGPSLAAHLRAVVWPAYYLDFESVMTAIPLYGGIAPYTQVPTQYSIHVCSGPGKVIGHQEYLADASRDCRMELAERLIADVGVKGSVVVYHATFERGVLSALAKEFRDLSASLLAIIGRIVDLKEFLADGFYHPDFHGSLSIKTTLPVLVPGMSYEEMEIGGGDTASALFARMAKGQCDGAELGKIRKNLLAYCGQDTLAMVRLHERLLELF